MKYCSTFLTEAVVNSIACVSHVEQGYNTSIIELQVIEDDEKGTWCLGA
jgi:hypothetical protein